LAQNQKATNYQENEQVPVAKVATSLGHPHFLHNKKHLALFPVTFISFKFGHNIQSDSNHIVNKAAGTLCLLSLQNTNQLQIK